MKKIIFIFILLISITSCEEAGTSERIISGDELSLAPKLRGTEIYKVHLGEGGSIFVGIRNNQITSVTNGDVNLILFENGKQKLIPIKKIISENDSIMVVQKKDTLN